jgi:large subunit ribosomal protein L18
MNKKESRLRRAKSTRAHIRELGVARLSVHRTGQHLYAQVIDATGAKVVAAASTVQKSLAESLKGTKNLTAAAAVGKAVAERALAAGVEAVAFDRSGFRYHGRIKALADAAREAGLKF